MTYLKTIEWADQAAVIVDQTQLPAKLVYEKIETIEAMRDAIRTLKVRGAPAIGIAAAFGLYLGVREVDDSSSPEAFLAVLDERVAYLASSRPTAVNLFWALKRVKEAAGAYLRQGSSIDRVKASVLGEARAILEEDRRMCRSIGEHGAALLRDAKAILTHCNAGGLATSQYGTALAPVYVAAEQDRYIHVYADETRPLLQGARITAFELRQADIPVTLICDNMAATVMARRLVDAVVVGADRIAANGDTVNKIGTYGLAILARQHDIPLYVAAPSSTFDLSLRSGREIPIEERDSREVTRFSGHPIAPAGINVFNPAFDMTPNQLITAFITDKGVIEPPFLQNLQSVFA
ncbi:MAG: S-methyl-5-thioribose-1-phosphate isomerase [Chitinispirillaceae bacterium]|nr:S-methyl-5-thioribose-1-phosphate isomerase [Chitinispirillaceae bacterium]